MYVEDIGEVMLSLVQPVFCSFGKSFMAGVPLYTGRRPRFSNRQGSQSDDTDTLNLNKVKSDSKIEVDVDVNVDVVIKNLINFLLHQRQSSYASARKSGDKHSLSTQVSM